MPDPRLEYSKRLESYLQTISAKDRLHIRIGNSKLAAIVVGAMLTWLSLKDNLFTSYWLFLPAAIYAVLAIAHEYTLRALARANTAATFYRRGIDRIEDRWAGTGQTGDRFRTQEHVYAEDLDLFGRGCLFELLSTARLPMGEDVLAKWLCSPSAKPAVLERQNLIVELREKLDLREDLAVKGEALRARLNPQSLLRWAEGERALPTGPWRSVCLTLAILTAVTLPYGLVTKIYWPLLLVLIAEAILLRWLRNRAHAVMEGVSCNAEGLALFSEILERLDREPFTSPRLQGFTTELKRDGKPASQAIRKLARIVYWIDAQHSLLAHLADFLFLYTVQVAFVAENWRRRWGPGMRAWIEITGEMEALLSLASYSFEHPDDPFPEFVELDGSPAFFHGEELGHPLLPASRSVRNSLRLDNDTRVLLVSGSNMSGKSTFLRVVGINTVLAMAGAPIRGKSLQLTPLTIGTRIRTTDSLQEGRSGFYAEILHIRRVFDSMQGAPPLLFLFDELLEGTNSKDRKIGAEGLIHALLARGAIGIVTTHDLALAAIAQSIGGTMRNMHFQDHVENGQMRFDYTLRDGVVAKSNAIELMRLIGLEI